MSGTGEAQPAETNLEARTSVIRRSKLVFTGQNTAGSMPFRPGHPRPAADSS